LGFSVDVVWVGVCFAFFGFFFYDVIAQTMGRNYGSTFGLILGCSTSL